MDISIFTDKQSVPDENDLKNTLGNMYQVWLEIVYFTMKKSPGLTGEWNYPGPKYGWSFRIKDKKRAIIYLLPRDEFFKAAFVFGQKATEDVLNGSFSDEIKNELRSARVYAEGRGIRIEVKNVEISDQIKKLTEIKLKY